jgi:two-component system, NtrC family, response regulator AtoC
MASRRILVVEDDETLGASLRQRLQLEGFSEALASLGRATPDIVLSDIRLPDGDGETLMRRQFASFGMVPTIFMTAYGDIDQAVRLMREGAVDFVTKPFDLDALVDTLQGIEHGGAASGRVASFASSPVMEKIRAVLARAAMVDMPVLLLGETGVGKEVAARFVHDGGPRVELPFVPVNCGALPEELADSMLFGHERGAFTGAASAHRGFLEESEGGTLFLDEIADLSPALQVKLLRVLESREFRRLGGSRTLKFEGRVVCATNKDLAALVGEGAFREDLWFRINVITCAIPPLRERREEIGPLLEGFVRRAATRIGRESLTIDRDALDAAMAYPWPGNIRELINRADRAVALGEGEAITRSDLFPEDHSREGPREVSATVEEHTLSDVRDAAERQHIKAALARAQGSTSEAARRLGVSRSTLWEKMRKLGIGDGES